MSLPPILLYPGRGKKPAVALGPLANALGEDLRGPLSAAAEAAGIPLPLALACVAAESDLHPRAERWGRFTQDARAALAAGNTARLQEIIDRAWPDVSFGYAQRIVLYHYHGDRSPRVENVLRVRQHVFDHPEEDLLHMARMLANCLARARREDISLVGGDELLGALVIYNAGHFPPRDRPYWQTHGQNVERYRRALGDARNKLQS